MRVHGSQNIRRTVASLIAATGIAATGLALSGQSMRAEDATAPVVRTTVVVFADRPLRDEMWTPLFEAVRTSVAEEKIQGLDGAADFVRGDKIVPGTLIDKPVVVYLHGDCQLQPLPKRTAYSVPLGWVRIEQGQIEPFIHVDCTRIGQVIGVQAQGLDEDARNRMMARAVSRVIVHEWVHVARQSAEHGRNGITKAHFGVEDLLGEPEMRAGRR
jgi:hypothetical protein